MDFVAQEREEADKSAVVHIPSGAKFQVFLSSEAHIAQHQCESAGPRLQPIGLGRGSQSEHELPEDKGYGCPTR